MGKDLTLLIAEDDYGNFLLTKRNLLRWGVACPIIRFNDGRELLEYLYTAGISESNADTDFILLLDINMPAINGFEVLKQIRHDPILRKITVIILTTSDDFESKQRCEELGCDAYFVKPLRREQFVNTLISLRIKPPILEIP